MPRTASPTSVRPAPLAGATARDLVADVTRSGALLVVVAWHWVFAITHRRADGTLTMPNPVDEIPYGWALTWALQVMPAFFVVSGAVNLASLRRRPSEPGAWVRARIRRLATAVGVVVAGCVLLEALSWGLFGRSGWTARHVPVLVPLWTVAILAVLTPLTPVLDRCWRHRRRTTALVGIGVLAGAEVARFAMGFDGAGLVSTATVWTGAYALGFAYRDAVDGRHGPRVGAALAGTGLLALVVLTSLGPYPASMVATRSDDASNLWPTAAPVLALALVQAGVLIAVHDRLQRRFEVPTVRRRIEAIGAIGLPVYLLHMFALVLVVHGLEGAGVRLPATTSTGWWLARPFFLAAPALVLAPMVLALRRILR